MVNGSADLAAFDYCVPDISYEPDGLVYVNIAQLAGGWTATRLLLKHTPNSN